jgi:hypothetical protein
MAVLRLYITAFQFNPKFSIEGVYLAVPSTVIRIFLFHLLTNIIHSIPFFVSLSKRSNGFNML